VSTGIGTRALLAAAVASALLCPSDLLAVNCTPLVGLPQTSAGAINVVWSGTVVFPQSQDTF
jgi:hypothetical protein